MKIWIALLLLLFVAFPAYAQSPQNQKPEIKRPLLRMYGYTNAQQPNILERRLETTEVGAEIAISKRVSLRFGLRNDRASEPLNPQPTTTRRLHTGIVWYIH